MDKLSKFPLFKNAPNAFHNAIASRLKLVQYHAQEYVVKYGEPAKAMYWILRGSVAVTSPDGEAVFAELVAGQFFGEIGILFNRPRTATVIARTKVLLGVLTVDNFNQVLPDFPAVERTIRDEAQERLSMQDKRTRNGVTNIIQSSIFLKDSVSTPGSSASDMANQVSALPGPSIPPARIRSPSPQPPPSSIIHPTDPIAAKVLETFSNNLLEPQPRRSKRQSSQSITFSIPQIHDNVDHSIPTRDFLRSLPMFTLLPSNMIHELVLGVEPKRYDPFEFIVRKGDLGREIFFIVNGEVEVLHPKRISLANSEGDKDKKVDMVIARLGTGQYFGEMAFLNSLSHDHDESVGRSADIRSVSRLDVLVVSGDQLENLISRYPRICDEMKETATKRINRNKNEEEDDQKALANSPFSKWKGLTLAKDSTVVKKLPSTSSSEKTDPIDSSKGPTSPTSSSSSSAAAAAMSQQGSAETANLFEPASASSSSSSSIISFKDSFSTTSSSIFDDNYNPKTVSRKRSISTLSPISPLDHSTSQQPLSLTVPPLNPPLPSINQFPSQMQQRPFQYMNHAKRVRLNNISGQRRRSSVLKTGVLSDRILLQVFKLLPLPELMKLRIICRRWRQLLYVAPGFFETLDLTPYNTSIDDKSLIQIIDFVGSRPKFIDISDCFHITDVGFCYMVNEIGMSGQIQRIKMTSVWEVSAMAIMDLTVPSVGRFLEELDLTNCRKVRDDVIERLIGFESHHHHHQQQQQQHHHHHRHHHNHHNAVTVQQKQKAQKHVNALDEPVPGMEEFDEVEGSSHDANIVGCKNLKRLYLGYCKHLTDRSMYHIALHASERLESLDITRCTTITDVGFAYWAYRPFTNLKKLKLSDCTFLTDKSIIAIASSSQFLEILDLSFCCALTDLSIEVLCLGCPNLKQLDLSFCGSAVSDSSLLAISIHLRNLEQLKIKGCVRVTRAGVDALLSSSIPLKLLDMSQCRNVHFYSNNTPAAKITPIGPNSKSAFVTTSHDNVVEIII
jgi:F-box/leucine-rich repeat protein 7